MALPVTITGISTAVAPVGPFKSAATLISQTTQNSGGLNFGDSVGLEFAGQTFTVGASDISVSQINLIALKGGLPTDNVIVEIYATSGGLPTGSALATTTPVSAATFPSNNTIPTTFYFPTVVTLSASTVYAFVLKRTGAIDSVNYPIVRHSGTSAYAGGSELRYQSGAWVSYPTDLWFVLSGGDTFYFFGRDGTTATTLQAFKSTAPDTSWASIATKTGFTTAILNLQAYQVGSTIHLLVQDGTASTSLATKYVSYDALTDTFLATIETVAAASSVGPQGGTGAPVSGAIVVRNSGEVVAFYNGAQTKTSGTFYGRVYYQRRTGVNTWTAAVEVDAATAAVATGPLAVLGASDRVHFMWCMGNVGNIRTLTAANTLGTLATSTTAFFADAVSYARGGVTKVVVTNSGAGQSTVRFDSADTPSPTVANQTISIADIPHRIGVDPVTNDVTIVYRSTADSDLWAIKSTDDGATFGSPVSFFVGTVASADTNLSRSSTGSFYSRGGYDVVGYVVNDNGTWKYNEYVVRAPAIANAWNVNDKSTNTVLSNGDKTANNPSTTAAVRSTTKRLNGAAGKYYAEIQAVTKFADAACNVGIKDASAAVVGTPFAARINGYGDIYIGNTYSGITTTAPVNGGIISLAWDTGAELFWVRTTSGWNGNVANDPATGVGGIDFSSAAAVDHALWSQSGTFTIRTTAAELTQVAPSGFLSWMGETLSTNVNYTDTITPSSLPIVGQDIVGVFVGSVAYADTITASALPITGATLAPIYTANYADTLTPSSVPINGAALADVFASKDTLAAGTLPIVGTTIVDAFARSDTITAAVLPIVGQTITPVFAAAPAGTHLDPARTGAGLVLSNNNLTVTNTSSQGSSLSTAPGSATKMYAEGTTTAIGYTIDFSFIGVGNSSFLFTGGVIGLDSGSCGVMIDGNIYRNGSYVGSLGAAISVNDCIGVAVDTVAQTVQFRDITKGGSWTAPISIAALGAGPIFFGFGMDGVDSWTANFDTTFLGTPPADGYSRWDGTAISAGGINYSDTISPSSIPIDGAAIAPIYSTGYSDSITPTTLPIVGTALTPVYTARYSDSVTPSALPIGGQTVAPIYTARYADSIAPSSVPIVGQVIAPIYTARYSDTLTPSGVPIVGQAITPVFSAGAINYTDTITPSAVPIVGAALSDTARYSDTLTASALPIGGMTITPIFSAGAISYTDTITPSAVPLIGAVLTAVYTARYADTLTASGVPITGSVLADRFARSDTLAAGTLPIIGTALADIFARSDTLAASALPIGGLALSDVFARSDTLTAGVLPIFGQIITPVFTVGVLTGKTWVNVAGVWKQPTTYVNASGVWTHPVASFVKDAGIWKQV